MSYKHIKEYYNKICEDYHEMIETLHELEEEAQTTIVPPEAVEKIETIIKPMKDNYERWSYMMFLLNMPNKKSKQKAYSKQFNKIKQEFEQNNNLEALRKENKECVGELKNVFR